MNFTDKNISLCRYSNRVKLHTVEEAKKAAARINRRDGFGSRDRRKLFAYPCPICYCYHLSTVHNSYVPKRDVLDKPYFKSIK